jgi:hypothetical protein
MNTVCSSICKSYIGKKHYAENGIYILENNFGNEFSDSSVLELRQKFFGLNGKKPQVVFQQTHIVEKESTQTRLQITFTNEEFSTDNAFSSLRTIWKRVLQHVGGDSKFAVYNILLSKGEKQPTDQLLHTDFDACRIINKVPEVAILALQNNTKLNFIRGSHSISKYGKGVLSQLVLNKGEVAIFHGGLVHGGVGYEADNIRMHVYICKTIQQVNEISNRTFILTANAVMQLRADSPTEIRIRAINAKRKRRSESKLAISKRLHNARCIEEST